jgi:hypothetical protein
MATEQGLNHFCKIFFPFFTFQNKEIQLVRGRKEIRIGIQFLNFISSLCLLFSFPLQCMESPILILKEVLLLSLWQEYPLD